jgi:2-dehydropantoate 2-reductase
MRILVYGAGVLGTLYGARLSAAGHDVSILARSHRLEEMREHGLVLEDARTGRRTVTRVPVVQRLGPDEGYDLIVVLVRKSQLASVLPALAANRHSPNILFMVNNAAGPKEMIRAIGAERVLLGFPGAGGTRDGHVIRYSPVPALVQPTMVGELDGTRTERVRQIASAFKRAGFSVSIQRDMDAWLKTHVAVVSPIANALYMAGGDPRRLARTRDAIVLMVRAIREGLQVLRALGVAVTPWRYHFVRWMREPLLVAVLRASLRTEWADLVIARHASGARDEMAMLADEFLALAQTTSVPIPAIARLAGYVDPAMPPARDGSAAIALDWRSVWVGAGVLTGLGFAAFWLSWRKWR